MILQTKKFSITLKKFFAVTILVSSSLAWFFLFQNYIDELSIGFGVSASLNNSGTVVFFLSILVSAIIGSAMAERVDRRRFLFLWIISGLFSTLPFLLLQNEIFWLIFCALSGISFGIGFPASQAFFAYSTKVEERCRISGLIFLAIFTIVVFSSVIIQLINMDVTAILLFTAFIKGTGLLTFVLDPVEREKKPPKSWKRILTHKDFGYFILAYILFNIANGLVQFILEGLPNTPDYQSAIQSAQLLRYLGLGFTAFITGFVADRIGRKKPIIIGLILIGISYALIGLVASPNTLFLHLILSGFAWGIIMVIYLAVPGDLAFPGSGERYYALGAIIPLILYTSIVNLGTVIAFNPQINVFSSILSSILFIAILPILYAKETLPSSKMRKREMEEHVEKLEKIVKESQGET